MKEKHVSNVLEVQRESDRSLKLKMEGLMLNHVRIYAPQIGYQLRERKILE